AHLRDLPSLPTRRSSDLTRVLPSLSGSPAVRFKCNPTPSDPVPRSAATAWSHPGAFTSTEIDDTTPAACASRMPSFTPDDSPKSSAFTTRRPPLGVTPPPVVPTDARQVAQHGRRIGREAHGARLVVVAILHGRLPYPEPVLTRDVQQLDIEPEPGDGEARE